MDRAAPLFGRVVDALSYDRDAGVARLLDQREWPVRRAPLVCPDADAVAAALAGVRGAPAALLAVYGLALAARAWRGRPTDAARSALIQAAERLRQARPDNPRLPGLLAGALARADAALLAGEDAEAALLAFAGDEMRRIDREAERCGRRAAGLLDAGDTLLLDGVPGGAAAFLLASAPKLRLLVAAEGTGDAVHEAVPADQGDGSRVGDPAPHAPGRWFAQASDALAAGEATVYIATARRVALDGAVAVEPGVARRARLAAGHGVPCYLLAPGGPEPGAPDAVALAGEPAVLPPAAISAIVTSRGIYRPAMIARHLDDGDAPR
jgi:methylthioribose-1-phosphate isomerase